jgi:hypothetical protein
MYLPPEQHAALPASAAVTAVTGYSSSTPLFFGRCSIAKSSGRPRPPARRCPFPQLGPGIRDLGPCFQNGVDKYQQHPQARGTRYGWVYLGFGAPYLAYGEAAGAFIEG